MRRRSNATTLVTSGHKAEEIAPMNRRERHTDQGSADQARPGSACPDCSPRLDDAWSAAPRRPAPRASPAAASPLATHPDETPVVPRPLIPVLSVSQARCGLNDASTALPTRDHQYLVTSLVSPSVSTVERHLGTEPPRLVLMDLRWCEAAGPALLQRLRQMAASPDWVVCWPRPSRQWLPHILACGARGALTCDATPQARVKALDGVLTGEIWLPRQVLQWLYAQMLDTSTASVRAVEGAARLTPREAEVMALIHQGLTNPAIAERLGVSVNTVKKHLTAGFEKLGVQKRRQLLG
jgi:DNA-binding NarL/FixJ family response regulator